MEHIISLSFGIDDADIKQRIVSSIEKHFVKEVNGVIKAELTSKQYYGDKTKCEQIAREIMEQIMEENKDAIIQGAIDKLADRLSRTKKVKEALDSII